jgi:hypothetical protein
MPAPADMGLNPDDKVNLCSLNLTDQISHQYKPGKIIVLYILISDFNVII